MSQGEYPRTFSRQTENNNDVFGQLLNRDLERSRRLRNTGAESSDYYQFPINLGNDEYRSFVLFSIYTNASASIENITDASDNAKKGAERLVKELTNNETARAAGRGVSAFLGGVGARQLAQQLLGRKYRFFATLIGTAVGLEIGNRVLPPGPGSDINDSRYDGNEIDVSRLSTRINPPEQLQKETIALYMPQKISIPHLLDYNTENMRGSNIVRNITGGDSALAAKTVASLAVEKAISSLSAVTSTISDDLNLKAGVQASTRLVANTMKTLMFSGVNQRRFEFTYEFAPKSREESEIIYDIIKLFKYYAYPSLNVDLGSLYFNMPAEFLIEYYEIDKTGAISENQFLNKIAPCVLTEIVVDYSPQGAPSFHEDGSPTLITVSLNFMEVEVITQDHVAKGY